jgi:hypothetical protein
MQYLAAELDITMALNGCRIPGDISRETLASS